MLRLTRIGVLIYVGTLLVGIVPFAALAFSSGTLWFTRTCDVPLLAVPSVWLGDSVFLPLFNAGVYDFVRRLKSLPGGMPSRIWLVSACTGTALLSIAVNGYLHYQWTRDEYLGYIDPTPGRLALVGWWHLGFSVVESMLLGVFICLWLRALKTKARAGFHGFDVWKLFVWYSLLSTLDFAMSHALILRRHPDVPYMALTNWEGLLVIGFALGIYAIARMVLPNRLGAES
jgi:hypothetical protein